MSTAHAVPPDFLDPLLGEPAGIQTPLVSYRRVALTGHRPQGLTPSEQAWTSTVLHTVAWRLRSKYGAIEGISGLALGADTWWAQAVLAAGMRLAVYLPFEDQPVRWPEVDQAVWAELRRRARREVILGGPAYNVGLLHARNDAMLADCDLLVAVYKPSAQGGTKSVFEKAERCAKPVLWLNPETRTLTKLRW